MHLATLLAVLPALASAAVPRAVSLPRIPSSTTPADTPSSFFDLTPPTEVHIPYKRSPSTIWECLALGVTPQCSYDGTEEDPDRYIFTCMFWVTWGKGGMSWAHFWDERCDINASTPTEIPASVKLIDEAPPASS